VVTPADFGFWLHCAVGSGVGLIYARSRCTLLLAAQPQPELQKLLCRPSVSMNDGWPAGVPSRIVQMTLHVKSLRESRPADTNMVLLHVFSAGFLASDDFA
jgi:hypothetical protein